MNQWCCMCGDCHKVSNCIKFKSLNAPQRGQTVAKYNLCEICLNHNSGTCTGAPCKKCNIKHHSGFLCNTNKK